MITGGALGGPAHLHPRRRGHGAVSIAAPTAPPCPPLCGAPREAVTAIINRGVADLLSNADSTLYRIGVGEICYRHPHPLPDHRRRSRHRQRHPRPTRPRRRIRWPVCPSFRLRHWTTILSRADVGKAYESLATCRTPPSASIRFHIMRWIAAPWTRSSRTPPAGAPSA